MGRDSRAINAPVVCMGVWNGLRHDARVARAASALAEKGVNVIVIAASWDPSEWGWQRHEGGFNAFTVSRRPPWALAGSAEVSIRGLISRCLKLLPSLLRFTFKLWATKANVYHAHDLQALPWVWGASRLRRRPVIYDAHEVSTDRTAFKAIGAIITAVEGFFARRSNLMIVTTDMRADHFAECYGVNRPVVVQNRPRFQEPSRTNRIRDQLGITDDLPLVLYQGGMQPGRGLEKLVEQIPFVRRARFIFLGGGVLKESLRARVVALGVSERAHFLDAVPWEDLLSWTVSADIGVQLIENTGFNHYSTDSNKLFEYIMAGLPVLASDFPEIRKVVDSGKLGILVNPADTKSIREQLIRLTENRDLRLAYASAARRERKGLSWEIEKIKLLSAYEPFLGMKSRDGRKSSR